MVTKLKKGRSEILINFQKRIHELSELWMDIGLKFALRDRPPDTGLQIDFG